MSQKQEFNDKARNLLQLFKRTEEINKPNRHGTNKFIEAIEKKKVTRVEAMLEQGAQLDFRTAARNGLSVMTHKVPYATGSTPLHAACLQGAPAIVDMLLEKGAEINARNDAGHTPLDYALLSYAYFRNEHEKKSQSKFAFQRSVARTQDRVDDYATVIRHMLEREGKPSLFILPDEFRAPLPQPAAQKQMPPPLP